MTFKAHSDASYLSRSRIGGVLFLDNPCQKNDFVNAAVDPFSNTNLNVVFASAVEAEFAAVFITVTQETEPLQVTHSLNSDIPNNHLNNQTMLSVDKVIVRSSMSFKCAGFFAVLQAQMNESNELALVRQIALDIDCQLKTICLQYVSTKTRQTLLRRHSTVDVDEAKTSKTFFLDDLIDEVEDLGKMNDFLVQCDLLSDESELDLLTERSLLCSLKKAFNKRCAPNNVY